jgi:anti-sigma B factor antagonist
MSVNVIRFKPGGAGEIVIAPSRAGPRLEVSLIDLEAEPFERRWGTRMFDAKMTAGGDIRLSGRFDASQTDKAREVLDGVSATCSVDFSNLEYISSAGLSVLLFTQKRLSRRGHCLRLKNLNPHIRQVFEYAGFDLVFEID